MNASLRQAIIPILLVALIGLGSLIWFSVMEKRIEPAPHVSAAAQNDSMLAATLLLMQQKHVVTAEDALSMALLKPLPQGTMILAENSGIMTPQQGKLLLDWVAEGNTLIASPKSASKEFAEKESKEPTSGGGDNQKAENSAFNFYSQDPLGEFFGVQLVQVERSGQFCGIPTRELPLPHALTDSLTEVECIGTLNLPGASYPLRLSANESNLASTFNIKEMWFSDQDAQNVRAFKYGKGQMVFIAHNYFDNENLSAYDNAEWLLGLANLNHDANAFLIVRRLDSLSWYRALWDAFPLAICSLGCGALLWFWLAIRRFGPVLPEPALQRRAVMEHVDASGRWLWKTTIGRDILLLAVRTATNKILVRRLPILQKIAAQDQIKLLAQQSELTVAELDHALLAPASKMPVEFTRQIKILQQLRKHYER